MATPPAEVTVDTRKALDAVGLWAILKPFVQGITEALTGRLTVEQNMSGAVVEVRVQALADDAVQADPIPLKPGVAPVGVVVWRATDDSGNPVACGCPGWSGSTVDGKAVVRLHTISGLTPGTAYKLKLAIHGG